MLKYARKAVLWTFGQTMPDRAADWFEKVILKPRSMGGGGGGEVVPFPDGARTIRVPYGHGWIVAREWENGSSANSGNAATPTTPAVLLMHGWGSSSSRMAGFVQPLLDAGYRVIMAFDRLQAGDLLRVPDFGGGRGPQATREIADSQRRDDERGHTNITTETAYALRRHRRRSRRVGDCRVARCGDQRFPDLDASIPDVSEPAKRILSQTAPHQLVYRRRDRRGQHLP